MLTHPTIHPGGTSREALALAYQTAIDALYAAIGAVELTEPHARDYPSAGAYLQARAQHVTRLAELRRVQADLSILLAALYP